jgi:hypothetical protein
MKNYNGCYLNTVVGMVIIVNTSTLILTLPSQKHLTLLNGLPGITLNLKIGYANM